MERMTADMLAVDEVNRPFTPFSVDDVAATQ